MTGLQLEVAMGDFAALRLDPGAAVPSWAFQGDGFSAVVRTATELSLLVRSSVVPTGFDGEVEPGWRGLFVRGKLEFGLVGILADLTACLAGEGVGILAVSTFDTDWLFVKAEELERARQALSRAGHTVASAPLP